LVLHIIKKDFKLLLRSKSSALIIILGPILLILLVSFAFNTSSIYDIKVGVYSEKYTPASESVIAKLTDKEFRVIKEESATLCIEGVKSGKTHICVIIPPDLDTTKDTQNEITFHVDYSRVNLAWIILNVLYSKVEEQSSQWSFDLTMEVLNKLEETKNELDMNYPLIKSSVENTNRAFSKSDNVILALSQVDTKYDVQSSRFGEMKSEINELFTDKNLSKEETKKVLKELNNMEAELEEVDARFESIDSSLKGVQKDLSAIKELEVVNKNNINSLKSSIEKVDQNVASLKVKNATTIVNPIMTSIKPVTAQKTNLDYIASTLIVLMVMFISVLLSSTVVMADKTSKSYFRRQISPTSDITFVIATYLTIMLIMVFQLGIILSISSLFLSASFILPSLLTLSLILLVLSTLFIFAGMIIGCVFNSEETSILAAVSFSSILLFFSNTILPMENMPVAVKQIALFNPFVIGQNLLSRLLLFQSGLDSTFYALIAYIAALFLILMIIQKHVAKKMSG